MKPDSLRVVQSMREHMQEVERGLLMLDVNEKLELVRAMRATAPEDERGLVHLGVLEFIGQRLIVGAERLEEDA